MLRSILDTSNYSNISIRSNLENGNRVYSINLPVEYAEPLHKCFMEESKKEHTGIQLVLDPAVLDIEVLKKIATPDVFGFKDIDFKNTQVEGIFPIIIDTVPLKPPKIFNTRNKKDES